ncbi:MAG TPA: sulfotransferase [Thermoanaerobaculia bacterium]|nr:sulfotransferase [Thermoanaerobaculia bacterium]
MTQELFLIGNKRSGSSLLARLLSLHPGVRVTHESDIAWILYQARNGWPRRFRCYPWDGPLGMRATLRSCRSLLRSALAAGEETSAVFRRVQSALAGLPGLPELPEETPPVETLAWLGDKKPVQHADPRVHAFLRARFPGARYIHLVRHPRAVVASMIEAAGRWQVAPGWWKQEPRRILERWAVHERWALEAGARGGCSFLRFEDLCQDPAETLGALFGFLGLDLPGEVAGRARAMVRPDPNRKYDSFPLPLHPEANRLREHYGYGSHPTRIPS